ncbi:interferon-related developmental regulator-domain-containing protein [Aspergillus cavernicola]|uniref:Interferon-related developmental regulator-domain-containing protein n=1 Tax=Aspergillus cavernicola TaxID=176166 RepID=A0ABR4I6X9_9EURO
MPDLRRQVLESGKTVSRKAASREGSGRTSRNNSAQNSRQSSRNASRQASDDEDAGYLSDDTAISLGSLDDTEHLELENNNSNWTQELLEVAEDILDRKRSSVYGREETYAAYCRLSKFHYVEKEIHHRVPDLLGAFKRSIKAETSVRETTLALRALELLAITTSDYTIYKGAEPLLTRAIRDSTSITIKAAAIHCLGTCTMFGGGGEDDFLDQMSFLLDIVASDGQSIDAQDDSSCVTAALQEWGFLATELDDFENESEDSIQILMDQLSSGESSVQIAAGESIALLYEKSYTEQEDDDDEGLDEDGDREHDGHDSDSEEEPFHSGPKLVKRYNAYHNTPELERQLQSLATVHSKRISKRDKKSLHSNFASIRTTVANPRRGPMYNTAIDQDTNRHYGNKLTVKINKEGAMHIDRWWKWIRLNSLRRVLQGGFANHYFHGNPAVLESLPVVMVRMDTPSDRSAPKKAAKTRQNRRWAMQEFSDDD